MSTLLRYVAVFISLFAYSLSFGAGLTGVVVGVADGDTVTLLTDAGQQEKVRLAGIDAPEKSQAFGSLSKRSLSDMAFQKRGSVEWQKRDRYGRIVGKLRIADVDVGLQQVADGLAWHYKAYEREQSASDRKAYGDAETTARSQRIGLWRDPDQIEPWNFRRMKRRQ